MEAEGLHGFCFMRKPWREMPRQYRNSLIICAVNPFLTLDPERLGPIIEQIDQERISELWEIPKLAFYGRLLSLAKRTLRDTLMERYDSELEIPLWSVMVTSFAEVVATHNLGFHRTGLLREAYTSVVNSWYAKEEIDDGYTDDLPTLKIRQTSNWLRTWTFMEGCGFTPIDELDGEDLDTAKDT